MKNHHQLIYLSFLLIFSSCKKNAADLTQIPSNSGVAIDRPTNDSLDTPAVIVIIGASTAAGTGANPADSAWVNRLRLETMSNPRQLNYVNLAKGGFTTYQGMPSGFVKAGRPLPDTARNITKALSLHPNLVMITFPSNDLANGYAPEEVISNYAAMVQKLDSARVPYILFGTQPRNLNTINQRMALQTLNVQLKSIYTAKANDYYDQLSTADYRIKPELSFGDGIHLNNKGHYLIVTAVRNHPVFRSVIN